MLRIEPSYNSCEDLTERIDSQLEDIIQSFLSKAEGEKVGWEVIPKARISKIWLDYGKTGIVRDEKGMARIADRVLDLIARLNVANLLSGHDYCNPREYLESHDYNNIDPDSEEFLDFLETEDGGWYVSDYGLPKLMNLYSQIYDAKNSEEKLLKVDMVLNIVHQRSDLAAFFIEGGTRTLVEISNQ